MCPTDDGAHFLCNDEEVDIGTNIPGFPSQVEKTRLPSEDAWNSLHNLRGLWKL